MSDLSKRQMIINQLSNQHKTYTLFTNGNECAFSTTGIDNNVIKLEGSGSYYTNTTCLLYTSPSPRDRQKSRMPSSA